MVVMVVLVIVLVRVTETVVVLEAFLRSGFKHTTPSGLELAKTKLLIIFQLGQCILKKVVRVIFCQYL